MSLFKKQSLNDKLKHALDPQDMLTRLQKKYLNQPSSETWSGWNTWHRNTKAASPVLYFILETVPRKFRYVQGRIGDVSWNLKMKYFVKPNTIRIDIARWTGDKSYYSYGYKSTDWLLTYGIFQEFVNFVERTGILRGEHYVDWNATKEYKKTFKEIAAIYEWVNNMPAAYAKLEQEYPAHENFIKFQAPNGETGSDLFFWAMDNFESLTKKQKSQVSAYNKATKKHREKEEKLDTTRDEMLLRIVKIKNYLTW